MAAGVHYREMTPADIPAGLRLCRAARWKQLEEDWRIFLDNSPRGCRVAERDGNVIGTVATLPFGDRFSWISMVLVDPVERGAGIGTRLLEEALDLLGNGVCARLDATPAGQPLYARRGFVEEYAISRMTATIEAAHFATDARARPMREEDFGAVLAIDQDAFGADRAFLLRSLFHRAPGYAWVAIEHSAISGYCFGRPGFLYHQLGPIVASNGETAAALAGACLARHHGARVGIDILRHDTSWPRRLGQRGFTEERSLVRMYRGENRHPGRVSDIYAIAGPEFG
jgi:GNAT superfamily N-acetyltransferase